MGEQIAAQCRLFLDGLCLGLLLGFVYDWLRLRRNLIRGGHIWMGIEDFFYCIFSGLMMFGLFYRDNSGVVRWFALAAAGIGFFLYRKGPSRIFLPGLTYLLTKARELVKKPIIFLGRGLKNLHKSVTIKKSLVKTASDSKGRREREKIKNKIRKGREN